jgi:UDP-N-acetylglucosamine--N-acetylmuramyl-(pentapeptide) pyrophosphoryl-undecaprenol N-acetylglucosamine transferase
MEADLVKRAELPYSAIPAAGLHGVGLRALPANLIRLIRGYFASQRILADFKPQVLLFTGGYVAVPMALAGRGIPSLLYVPDIEPGMALNALSRLAHVIALTTSSSSAYFPASARTVVTGYPTRPDLGAWDRARGIAHLGLDPRRKVLLVTGGSKGARSLNHALLANLAGLLPLAQIVHISGQLDWAEVQAAAAGLPKDLVTGYHPMPYLHEMGAALAAADLVVSRAGASALGEYPLFGLPAVLIPYPYAWRYQKVNAAYLVGLGAALMLEDARLADRLFDTLRDLLSDETRLSEMRRAMLSLARPQAASDLAGLVRQLALGEMQ